MKRSNLLWLPKAASLIWLLPGLMLVTACGNQKQSPPLNSQRLQVITAPAINAPVPTAIASASVTPAPTVAAPVSSAAPTAPEVPATVTAGAPTARPTAEPLKEGVLLEPMTWEPQTWNNCGPVSAMMAISYFGVKLTQQECTRILRPNLADKLVRADELVGFIQKQGLKARLRENGSIEKLQALLSLGVPVITMQWLAEDDDIAHYRTARGYDLSENLLIFNDSMDRHPKTVVDNHLQDRLWKAFDRRYIVVFTAAQEQKVLNALGEDADPATNLTRALEAAREYNAARPDDLDGWSNLGYLYSATGDCKNALAIWNGKLKEMLLPSDSGPYNRYLWYQLWPVECLNKTGDYAAVIRLAPNEINQTIAYAEMRYHYAIALAASGNRPEAIVQLKKALLDDSNFGPVYDLLAKLEGQE